MANALGEKPGYRNGVAHTFRTRLVISLQEVTIRRKYLLLKFYQKGLKTLLDGSN